MKKTITTYVNAQVTGTTMVEIETNARTTMAAFMAGKPPASYEWSYQGIAPDQTRLDANGNPTIYVAQLAASVSIEIDV